MTARARIGDAICPEWFGRLLQTSLGGWIPSTGLRIRADPSKVHPRIAAAIFWGLYERAERRLLSRYLDPRWDVVDLGASLGVLSCWIARRLPLERKMVCVEANADLIPILEANLARNAPDRHVTIRNQAIAYGGEEVEFYFGRSHEGGTASFAKHEGKRRVPAITLSNLLREDGIGEYTLVCDIEAGEGAILQNDPKALEACQRMVIELHEPHTDLRLPRVRDLRVMIEELGFRERARHGFVFVYDRHLENAG